MPVIVDAHRHFYDLQRFRYPFLEYPDFAALAKTYVLRDFAADAASVRLVGSVHVQAEVDHDVDPVLETAWLQSLADADDPGLPSVCVGYADLRRSDLDDVLERHCQYPIVRGIRQELWFDARSNRADIPRVNLLDDANWRRGYRRLAAYGLSFDLLVWPWQLADAAMFFAQAPDVPVILNHMGCPDASRRGRLAALGGRAARARRGRAGLCQDIGNEPDRSRVDDHGCQAIHIESYRHFRRPPLHVRQQLPRRTPGELVPAPVGSI